MIPKVIHYCWFGSNELSTEAKKCIASWKKMCPDYEVIEWNENNYDVHKNQYMSEAYDNKMWAFVSDYARLDIIYNRGGIYLDVDVEIIKPIDELLHYDCFMGFQDGKNIATGLGFGAIKGHDTIKMLLDNLYFDNSFIKKDGSFNLTPCTATTTAFFEHFGLRKNNQKQELLNVTILPTDFFCPQSFVTGKLNITKNTYSIHHFDGSWLPIDEAYRISIRKKLCRFLPKSVSGKIAKSITILKFEGLKALIKEIKKQMRHAFNIRNVN